MEIFSKGVGLFAGNCCQKSEMDKKMVKYLKPEP